AAEHSRDAYGILVCFGAAVGEEEGINVARRDLRELRAQARAHVSGHEWIGISKRGGLLLDCANHALVAMPDVDAHQLTVEVDETLAFGCPEVNSLRTRHWNWINCRLRRPLEERVAATERDNLFTRHGFNIAH